jgi:hypothetical protein
MRRFALLWLGATGTFLFADDVRLNQIQVIGTHNSYHIAPAPGVKSLIATIKGDLASSLDYTHRPLPEQFGALGIRQIELDVFADPKGGLFSKPIARTRGTGDLGPDPNENRVLDRPGFKVLHVQEIDFRTTVPTLQEGLSQIAKWSAAHPKHVPIMVQLELKDQAQPLLPTKPVPFSDDMLGELEVTIRAAFSSDRLIEPRSDMAKVIATSGWPTLESCRGKVMFVLDNEGTIGARYRAGNWRKPGESAVLFALRDESDPAAAVFKINDPVADFDRIQRLVKKGYMIRTRADADTVEARKNSVTRRDKAFASGAHWISTDFPEARTDLSPYLVRFDGGRTMRLNPLTAPGRSGDLEMKP